MTWSEQALEQAGVIARRQLIAAGLTPAQARRGIDNRRWQRLHPGVYAAFTGPIGAGARTWSALLAAGPGAVASHGTALWLAGVLPEQPRVVQISVPADRRPRHRPGVRLYRRRDLARMVLPTSPPRTRVEVAVIDSAAVATTAGTVLTLVFTATQGRFTTAGRLREELARRGRHPWRRLLLDVLADVEDGVASPLERRYRHDVERQHDLPRGSRNQGERRAGGGHRYRDVRYRRWRLVVELDGRQAHPDAERHRDLDRDNGIVVDEEETVLRFGWHAVALTPCEVARQVTTLLRRNGWPGEPVSCPRCG